MNDVSNRAVREFSEFLNIIEADFPKPTCTTAYEITMKSIIVSALITLDTEKQMDERFWNHLRVQRNILDFLYALWLTMTALWWMSFPRLSRTWWNMISLLRKNR